MSATAGSTQKSVMLDGVTIAPGVVETVAALAAEQTEGVAGVCGKNTLRKKAGSLGVEVARVEGNLTVAVHIVVHYGCVLPEVGQAVQRAVLDALDGQIGIRPDSVDIYIDGIVFEG